MQLSNGNSEYKHYLNNSTAQQQCDSSSSNNNEASLSLTQQQQQEEQHHHFIIIIIGFISACKGGRERRARKRQRQRELQQESIVTYRANPLKKSRHNPQYNIEINPRQPYNATKTIRHVIRLKISIPANGVADWQAGRRAATTTTTTRGSYNNKRLLRHFNWPTKCPQTQKGETK